MSAVLRKSHGTMMQWRGHRLVFYAVSGPAAGALYRPVHIAGSRNFVTEPNFVTLLAALVSLHSDFVTRRPAHRKLRVE